MAIPYYLNRQITLNMKSIIVFIFIAVAGFSSTAQAPKKILLVNGFLHVGNGETLQSALIGIENGKISLIKNSLAYTINQSEWDTIIQLNGKHIYPGFVAPNSTLGITEIDAVRSTRDFDEVGIFNPHVRSQIAYNVESKVISTVKTNGVLITQSTPRGGIISGTSSIMALEGWNWEDATLLKDDGIHLNWPESIDKGNRWEAANSKIEKNKSYEEQKREIYTFFEMASAYSNTDKNDTKDARFEAMRNCFKGKQRVYIHANEIQQLVDIIDFSKTFQLPFPVIVGGYDAYLVPRKLADAKIPVMLIRPHSLPENENDPVNLPYQLPYLLKQGGVKFCIQNEGDMEAMNARNIPFLAGTAMAHGLTEEEAISAISLWSCQIMGLGDHYGSIEKGKSATLFVSDGNALDMRTNQLFLGMIDGQFITLSNIQSTLFEKYQGKYAK